jgi:hypothetical protein
MLTILTLRCNNLIVTCIIEEDNLQNNVKQSIQEFNLEKITLKLLYSL